MTYTSVEVIADSQMKWEFGKAPLILANFAQFISDWSYQNCHREHTKRKQGLLVAVFGGGIE